MQARVGAAICRPCPFISLRGEILMGCVDVAKGSTARGPRKCLHLWGGAGGGAGTPQGVTEGANIEGQQSAARAPSSRFAQHP